MEVVEIEKMSETTGRMVYRFPVLREYLNPTMTLHGGLSAGFYDTATSWLLDVIRKPGFWFHFGVSRSMNITFLRPAAEGEMLKMEAEVGPRWIRFARLVLRLFRLYTPASDCVCSKQR